MKKFDYGGYISRDNVKCSDNTVIAHDAFSSCNGKRVPLVWNHRHESGFNILGNAILESREDGMYSYLDLNDTDQGRNARTLIEHGDIIALSVCANQLKQKGNLITHGNVREVSLVLAGADPTAYIDAVEILHSDDEDFEAEICEFQPLEICHAEKEEENETGADEAAKENLEIEHADSDDEDKSSSDESDGIDKDDVIEIFKTLTEKQKMAVYAILGSASTKNKEDGGKSDMKHNVFESENERNDNVICHADQSAILELAKSPQVGTLQEALKIYADDNNLEHDAVSSGFIQTNADGNVSWLFPEYKNVRPGAPELITNDQGWVDVVLRKVHKSPISRIRTQHVDIRNIEELRARGYQKGKQKSQTGNFALVRRETDPQTVYVTSALHRDDIVDITDFDYIQYLYNIDRMNLNEEVATAIMLGDSRQDNAADKIFPEHIRPIWTDDELYTLHRDINMEAMREELQGTETGSYFGDNYIYAEAVIQQALYAREDYKGTGTPDFFITPHMLNVMLLARDRNGRRIFSGKAELASALNVGEIYTAEQFANRIRTDSSSNQHKLLGIMCNLADYYVGSTKGGEITHFTDFDIKFNQHLSLLETRLSGAMTRVYAAIVLEEPYTA